jgi:hypothetical protein
MIGIVVFFLVLAVAAYGFSKGWFGHSESERRLAGAPLRAISEVRSGRRVKVKGSVSAIGPLMTSPIGARKCIGFRLTIQLDSEGHMTVLERVGCDPFLIRDNTGEARVEGPFLFDLETESEWDRLARDFTAAPERDGQWQPLPVESLGILDGTSFVLGAGRFRFRELLLLPGDRVRVLGVAFEELNPREPAGFRTPGMTLHLRGSGNEPTVIASAVERILGQAPRGD